MPHGSGFSPEEVPRQASQLWLCWGGAEGLGSYQVMLGSEEPPVGVCACAHMCCCVTVISRPLPLLPLLLHVCNMCGCYCCCVLSCVGRPSVLGVLLPHACPARATALCGCEHCLPHNLFSLVLLPVFITTQPVLHQPRSLWVLS